MNGRPTPPFLATIVSPGIVRMRWTPGMPITASLAAAATAAIDELNGERQLPLLVEVAATEAPTRAALRHFAHRCSAPRIALLGE